MRSVIASHPHRDRAGPSVDRQTWGDSRHTRPALLTVIYTNPDDYQPMIWASRLLRQPFSMTTICREIGSPVYGWPGVEVRRVGPPGSTSAKETASPLQKAREF